MVAYPLSRPRRGPPAVPTLLLILAEPAWHIFCVLQLTTKDPSSINDLQADGASLAQLGVQHGDMVRGRMSPKQSPLSTAMSSSPGTVQDRGDRRCDPRCLFLLFPDCAGVPALRIRA